jgi:hypothetical protein
MLEVGTKLLISHRRLFEKDQPRCFVGEVSAYSAGIVKVTGYSFVRDPLRGDFIRKNDPRTKIISITSGAFLVYQLPDETDIECLTFEPHDADILLTDGKTLRMNMTEKPHGGQI